MSTESNGSAAVVGSGLAAFISWIHWHSVGWLVLHALFGWFYVIYYLLRYSR